jgi:ABC-type uncharacterized transport system ATPase subunit
MRLRQRMVSRAGNDSREMFGLGAHPKAIAKSRDVYSEAIVSQRMVHSAQRMFVRLIHLKNSGFIILSGDVVHLEENFEKNRVPSLNTDKVESIASMEKIRQMIAAYGATLFINQDKKQTDRVKLLPEFYD